MQSVAPFVAFLFLSLFALSSSGSWLQELPAWLQTPLIRLRGLGQGQAPNADEIAMADYSDPTAALRQRLKTVDVVREHKTAHALHAAIGKILRASGTQPKQVVQHFEAARDAAVLGADQDTLLASHLDLAESYIEEGRASDSQHELTVATGVLADHFAEHRSKLNRLRGRAKFELGFFERALGYFKDASDQALQPQDKVHVARDVAMVHICLGKAGEAVQPLKGALDVLHAVRKTNSKQFMAPDGTSLPAATQDSLAADIHFHLAEAYHSDVHLNMHNSAFAEAHYKKALNLEEKLHSSNNKRITQIKRGIKFLDHGVGPELRCPRQPLVMPGTEARTPAETMKDKTFITKMNLLLAENRYDVVESELKASLRKHSHPYKSHEDALALNMLGNVYVKQGQYSKAAKQFRQALHAAIACCGARNQEAESAYEGLKTIKAELTPNDQRVASAAINIFFDKLETAGVPTVQGAASRDDETSTGSIQDQHVATAATNTFVDALEKIGVPNIEGTKESQTNEGSIDSQRVATATMKTLFNSLEQQVSVPAIEASTNVEPIIGSDEQQRLAMAEMKSFFSALEKSGAPTIQGGSNSDAVEGSSHDKRLAMAAMDSFFDNQ